ncbi:DUF167 family protein [Faunimonas sp. B44]|uniref:DUF167 family protein n=1 Tax=Faunimonas sp. B44 TaxID=3461493 RepID=UPI004044429E
MGGRPWRATAGGLVIVVRLTPRADRDRLDGVEILADGRPVLKARVRAVPERGAANESLERLLAASLGLPKSAVAIASGGSARLKSVRVAGDPATLEAALERLTS